MQRMNLLGTQPRERSTFRTFIPALLLALVFLALTLPPVFLGRGGESEQADERMFHLPAIERFADQWPTPDLVHYELAMTPGYHLMMAALWRATGSVTALRVVNAIIGLALALAMWWAVRAVLLSSWGMRGPGDSPARRRPGFVAERAGWLALLLALPLLGSPYVLGGAISLTTDNAALLGVCVILGVAASRPMTLALALTLGGVTLAIVLLRQVHLWLGGVVLFAAMVPSPIAARLPAWCRRLVEAPCLREGVLPAPPPRDSWSPLVGGAIALAIPAIAVGVFALMWGGLVPISDWSQKFHGQGPNPAAPAFCLALIGALGPCFLMFHVEHIQRLCAKTVTCVMASGVGLLVALAVRTSAQMPTADGPPPDGRGYGWLWRVAYECAHRVIPDIADRSIVITLLAPVGAAVLALLWRAAAGAGRARAATILLVALLGWLAAQTMNPQAWQRYFEPMVLVFLALLTAAGCGLRADSGAGSASRDGRGGWRAIVPWAGIALLALAEYGMSGITLFKEILNPPAEAASGVTDARKTLDPGAPGE